MPPDVSLHALQPARAGLRDYALAVGAVVAALLLRFLLNPILGQQGPFLILTLPIVATALYCGFGPALLATVLSTVVGTYLFVGSRPGFVDIWETANIGRTILFFLIGLSICIVGGRLRRARRDLQMTARQLAASVRSKDNFLAVLGHELRNPLAALRSTNEVLQRMAHQPEKVLWASEIIGRQVLQMTQISNDLLDMAQAIRGEVTIEREPVDLRAAVGHAVEQAAPLMEKKRQRLHAPSPGQPVQVLGDRNRLVQVFANLLNNAAKYTPDGGTIWLSIDADADAACVVVRDDGRGMDPAQITSLFEPFVQEQDDAVQAEGGLGLGLAIVRTLVQLHGGTVQAESEGRNRGSMFTVRLPRLQN